MKFRAYCIVVIGDTMGIMNEIVKISETQPSAIDGKGLYIATFISASSPSELTEFFKLDKRNFMLFELNNETSGVNIMKEETHQGLFGFLKTFKQENIDEMTDRLMNDIRLTSDTRDFKSSIKSKKISNTKVVKPKITEKEINAMTKEQKENLFNEMFNEMMDKGVEEMSENDKKILELLAK
jgi:hypothetical protein